MRGPDHPALPDVPQHVIQRGKNRQPVFLHADDERCSVACLTEAAAAPATAVHAQVLMTKHGHRLMTPRQANSIAKVVQSIGRRDVP